MHISGTFTRMFSHSFANFYVDLAADAIDFERVLKFARDEFNRIQNISNDMDSNLSWEFDELLNGYRRLDPLSGFYISLSYKFYFTLIRRNYDLQYTERNISIYYIHIINRIL